MSKLKNFFLFGLITIFSFQVKGQEQNTTTNNDFVDDYEIVSALDSLSALKFFQKKQIINEKIKDNKYNFPEDYIPYYPDSVYYYRMQKLDVMSPMELVYNPYVRNFIDIYAKRWKGSTSRVLGMAQMYFPIFEQQLDKFNLPLELKYLAIVESALNPKARSRAGAGGLWQFMYYTGRGYGLEVNSYVDDRNDPLKSTVAACKHMKDLFDMYHDWMLVLAAYNCGAGNVNKAIRRAGGKMNFWEIRPYLPRETRDYVPAFIAVNYVMNYTKEHNIYPTLPTIVYQETDTVTLSQPVTFSLLAEKLDLPQEELEYLNPSFRQDFIPASPFNTYAFRLPKKSIGNFINNEETLYAAYKLKDYNAYENSQYAYNSPYPSPSSGNYGYVSVTKKHFHKVKKGETLLKIARRYDATVSEIKRWNNLKSSHAPKGKILKIYTKEYQRVELPRKGDADGPTIDQVKPEPSLADNSNLSAEEEKEDGPAIEDVKPERTGKTVAKPSAASKTKKAAPATHAKYKVKKGESLSEIAEKHGMTTSSLMRLNNLKSKVIHPGQTLKVKK